jgi:hypothetical protein
VTWDQIFQEVNVTRIKRIKGKKTEKTHICQTTPFQKKDFKASLYPQKINNLPYIFPVYKIKKNNTFLTHLAFIPVQI